LRGLSIFCLGAFLYNLTLFTARKYIQPAPSGTLSEHKLIITGSFRIVRHPLYVSYLLIMLCLSLAFQIYWLMIPALLIGIGIYPMAKAEEKVLMEQFGDDYRQYSEKVGMLFPRESRSGV
jgi:protein-S-isoprenylcysteine O-methyltransferase Ste14